MFTEPFLFNKIILEKPENIIIDKNIPIFEKIVFKSDKPWEGEVNGYYTIIHNNNEYIMYYRASNKIHKSFESVCIASSSDGLNFNKNNLNFEYSNFEEVKVKTHSGIETHCKLIKGNKDNNKLFHNKFCHNFFPYYSKKDKCYIGLSGLKVENNGLYLMKSMDGIKWEIVRKILDENNVRPGFNHINHFDTCNTIIYNSMEESYYILIRDNRPTIENNKHMGRRVQYINIKDLSQEIKEICKPLIVNNNFTDYPIYSLGCTHYPNSKYFFAIPTLVDEEFIQYPHGGGRWIQKKKIGQILISNNCYEWDVVSENIFKKDMGKDNFMTIGIVQSKDNEKLYFYVQHDLNRQNNYISCYSFPMNRINKIICNEKGYIMTDLIKLNSSVLSVNLETLTEQGYINLELYDQNKNLILESDNISGNNFNFIVKWRSNIDINNNKYYIKFNIYNSILYSFNYN